METRVERVVLETARHRIVGDLTLPREGYRSRLSDYLNDPDREFMIVLEARVANLDALDKPPTLIPVLMVHRARVDLVFPLES